MSDPFADIMKGLRALGMGSGGGSGSRPVQRLGKRAARTTYQRKPKKKPWELKGFHEKQRRLWKPYYEALFSALGYDREQVKSIIADLLHIKRTTASVTATFESLIRQGIKPRDAQSYIAQQLSQYWKSEGKLAPGPHGLSLTLHNHLLKLSMRHVKDRAYGLTAAELNDLVAEAEAEKDDQEKAMMALIEQGY